MANILSLKRRIQAAKNVSKTTKAMQMIAASKLKRAQEAVTATRPYVNKISEMTGNIMLSTPENYTHPYLKANNTTGKTLLIIISPDKGLSGSLITNLVREFIHYQKETPDTSYIVIGKKLEAQVVRFNREIVASFPFGLNLPTFDMVYPLIKLIDDYYISNKVDSVKILTTEFTSVFSQKPKVVNILPIPIASNNEAMKQPNNASSNNFFMFEPSPAELLNTLLKHYVEMSVYQQLVEAFVSEQAAKMIAMQNATNNANDIIEDLQLEYNKTRQAKITSEILDITGASTVASQQ
jgi:F-type H+-transporting ATPase subunit gamma